MSNGFTKKCFFLHTLRFFLQYLLQQTALSGITIVRILIFNAQKMKTKQSYELTMNMIYPCINIYTNCIKKWRCWHILRPENLFFIIRHQDLLLDIDIYPFLLFLQRITNSQSEHINCIYQNRWSVAKYILRK